MPTLLPGRAATLAALRLVAPLTALVLLATAFSGRPAALGVVLGVVACAPIAATALSPRLSVVLAGGAVLAVAAGVVCGPAVAEAGAGTVRGAGGAALIVGGVAIAGVVATRGAAGTATLWPVATAAAIAVAAPLDTTAGVPVLAGTVLGAGAALVLGSGLPGRPEPVRVPDGSAAGYALGFGVGCGVLAAVGVLAQIGHLHWALLAFTALHPEPAATSHGALRRVRGTAVGAGAAAVVLAVASSLLDAPRETAGVLAAVCLVLSVAWSLRGETAAQYAYVVPAVAFGVAVFDPVRAGDLIGERLLLVGLGCAGAALAAWLLGRRTRVLGTRAGADS